MSDGTPTVLVIDDLEDLRTITCDALRALGYAAAGTASHSGALVSAMTVRPDVILLELLVDRASGLELVRDVRANRSLAGVPIVAVTRSTDLTLHDEAIRSGCAAVLVKPVPLSRLDEALRGALATGHAAAN